MAWQIHSNICYIIKPASEYTVSVNLKMALYITTCVFYQKKMLFIEYKAINSLLDTEHYSLQIGEKDRYATWWLNQRVRRGAQWHNTYSQNLLGSNCNDGFRPSSFGTQPHQEVRCGFYKERCSDGWRLDDFVQNWPWQPK